MARFCVRSFPCALSLLDCLSCVSVACSRLSVLPCRASNKRLPSGFLPLLKRAHAVATALLLGVQSIRQLGPFPPPWWRVAQRVTFGCCYLWPRKSRPSMDDVRVVAEELVPVVATARMEGAQFIWVLPGVLASPGLRRVLRVGHGFHRRRLPRGGSRRSCVSAGLVPLRLRCLRGLDLGFGSFSACTWILYLVLSFGDYSSFLRLFVESVEVVSALLLRDVSRSAAKDRPLASGFVWSEFQERRALRMVCSASLGCGPPGRLAVLVVLGSSFLVLPQLTSLSRTSLGLESVLSSGATPVTCSSYWFGSQLCRRLSQPSLGPHDALRITSRVTSRWERRSATMAWLSRPVPKSFDTYVFPALSFAVRLPEWSVGEDREVSPSTTNPTWQCTTGRSQLSRVAGTSGHRRPSPRSCGVRWRLLLYTDCSSAAWHHPYSLEASIPSCGGRFLSLITIRGHGRPGRSWTRVSGTCPAPSSGLGSSSSALGSSTAAQAPVFPVLTGSSFRPTMPPSTSGASKRFVHVAGHLRTLLGHVNRLFVRAQVLGFLPMWTDSFYSSFANLNTPTRPAEMTPLLNDNSGDNIE